ncbi:hypothetical protein ASPWEDRAFT_37959 [Aspergillus wentii DTO 134E9]|uniref:Fungal N-terminal domain-containing protein n=1 Tax=Aspergillus wentii DTO 134E9 TaxID=1073089 RepID=A0A1L9RNA7_ASPWE|nr:uncharacterized protein ASPWEDRAFT_37959 [Aspergillus wentii DTO 134E9]OJJ36392.1 hypothetical protein ASPWEDRAFT_37959 [Aspergillus wentii DTO 134E9]
MDPLLIASTAASLKTSCHEITSWTRAILNDKTPDTDQALSSVSTTLTQTSQLLDEISLTWRTHSAAFMGHQSASFGMWPSLKKTLDCTGTTIQGLRREIEPVLNSGKKKRFFKVHSKAWALGMRVRAILSYKGRLEGNCSVLRVGRTM